VQQRPLIVLGMHRSGTSALTGLLNLLGLYVGDLLLPPSPETNPKGFWEHAGIVDMHNRLLAELGSSWHDERNLPDDWWSQPVAEPFRRELAEILRRDFAPGSAWIVKDPRLCRLLPLWRPLFETEWGQPDAVVILRDPAEVARSLGDRDGISSERAHLLWLQHVFDAERWSRDYPRTVVTFDALLKDWRKIVNHMNSVLHLGLPLDDPLIQQRARDFLAPELRHYSASRRSDGRVARIAESVYQACMKMTTPTQLCSILAPYEREIRDLVALVSDWSEEIQTLGFTRAEFAVYRRRSEVLAQEIDRLKSTVSWKITMPLRVAWNLLGRTIR
jgi:hypothetical protein